MLDADIFVETGGVPDESSASLAVYGEFLVPEDITALLGTPPTKCFEKGHKPGSRSPAMEHGAWILQVRGNTPDGPDRQLEQLLSMLPDSDPVWQKLNQRYTVQVRIALHMDAWNTGFRLSEKIVSRIAAIGAGIDFDLYAYDQDDA